MLRASASRAGPRPLICPAFGEPDHQQSCVPARVENRVLARGDQPWFRWDSGGPLDGQGDVSEQAARVAFVLLWLSVGAEQLKGRLVTGSDPGPDLECRPVVGGTAKRNDNVADPSLAGTIAGDQRGNVTRGLTQEPSEERPAGAPRPAARVEHLSASGRPPEHQRAARDRNRRRPT